ncbi:MAG: 23S rRNA (adenine(2503)-C(2))-methyltransferase RlmN [Anaerolineales bacterium]
MAHTSMLQRPLILDWNFAQLQEILTSWQEPAYRAAQIWQGLYQQFWKSPEQFSNLPKPLRQKLAEQFQFSALIAENQLQSSDGQTVKTMFRLPDGKAIETVLMRYEQRCTLCISTQSGCAMGCVFCATGQMGFQRHLSSGEIIEQVLYFARQLKDEGKQLTNIVIMGMGEPFHNYDATLSAIDRLNDPQGFGMSERRFTISTVGLVPMIQRFASEKRQVNLAISLHAANDALRSTLLPINRKYPLSELIQACNDYVKQTGRRVTFEWALIRDTNDTIEHAHELARLVKGLLCHVNVIPLNPTQKYPGQPTTHQRAVVFKETLEKAGIPCTIRIRRGIDIQAGCGQLAIQTML